MFAHPAIHGINHLLRAESWARDRLKPFAGKRVLLRAPPLPDLRMTVTAEGLVDGADDTAAFELTLTVQPAALPHLMNQSEALLQHVEISGNAELASTVQFLFRNLKWDVEDNLAKVVGNIAARRMVAAGRDFAEWQKDALLRAGQNLAEYWTEEQPLLARPEYVTQFVRDVEALRDDLARLEARLNRLG